MNRKYGINLINEYLQEILNLKFSIIICSFVNKNKESIFIFNDKIILIDENKVNSCNDFDDIMRLCIYESYILWAKVNFKNKDYKSKNKFVCKIGTEKEKEQVENEIRDLALLFTNKVMNKLKL